VVIIRKQRRRPNQKSISNDRPRVIANCSKLPQNGVYGKFEVSTNAFGADEARSNLRRYNVAFGGGITPQWVAKLIAFSNLGSGSILGCTLGFYLRLPCPEVHHMDNGI
jgi:hypothetical protein